MPQRLSTFRYFDAGSDFVQLTLNLTTGLLRLTMKLIDSSDNSVEVESLSTRISRLNDGRWHSVRLERDGIITRFIVDNAMWSVDARQQLLRDRLNNQSSQNFDEVSLKFLTKKEFLLFLIHGFRALMAGSSDSVEATTAVTSSIDVAR
jgi:hypothetical protein